MEHIIEKVANGLRKMNKKPDYLIFLSSQKDDDWVWDLPTICDIHIIYTSEFVNFDDGFDCPFLPAWNKESDYLLDIRWFRRGYYEY